MRDSAIYERHIAPHFDLKSKVAAKAEFQMHKDHCKIEAEGESESDTLSADSDFNVVSFKPKKDREDI